MMSLNGATIVSRGDRCNPKNHFHPQKASNMALNQQDREISGRVINLFHLFYRNVTFRLTNMALPPYIVFLVTLPLGLCYRR